LVVATEALEHAKAELPEPVKEIDRIGSGLMSVIAAIVVVAFGVLLIGFTGVAFARPAIAERFLMRFASSARTHYVEQVCRLLVGTALVVAAPAMWQPMVFALVGWAIVVTSVALMCLPWQWHHRFGERVRPMLLRHLRLYALGSFAFGTLLLYGVFAGGRPIAASAMRFSPIRSYAAYSANQLHATLDGIIEPC
jgi:hypothetical protein